MMSWRLPWHKFERRLAALGLVLRAFAHNTSTGQKNPMRTRIGGSLELLFSSVVAQMHQTLAVN